MAETKWTSGEWQIGVLRAIIDKSGSSICYAELMHENDERVDMPYAVGETLANMHIIAAAPELYAALEEAAGNLILSGFLERDALMQKIRAALAKARGEQ